VQSGLQVRNAPAGLPSGQLTLPGGSHSSSGWSRTPLPQLLLPPLPAGLEQQRPSLPRFEITWSPTKCPRRLLLCPSRNMPPMVQASTV